MNFSGWYKSKKIKSSPRKWAGELERWLSNYSTHSLPESPSLNASTHTSGDSQAPISLSFRNTHYLWPLWATALTCTAFTCTHLIKDNKKNLKDWAYTLLVKIHNLDFKKFFFKEINLAGTCHMGIVPSDQHFQFWNSLSDRGEV